MIDVKEVLEAEQDLPPAEIEEPPKPPKLKWVPKKWRPIYEQVVAYHILGFTNLEIAKLTGFNHWHVGDIVSCPQAQAIIEQTAIKLVEVRQEKMKARLDKMTEKALDRMEAVLDNEELAMDHPIPVFDRALKFAQATRAIQPTEGTSEKETTNNVLNVAGNVTAIAVPKEMMEGLLESMKKADEVMAKRISAPK